MNVKKSREHLARRVRASLLFIVCSKAVGGIYVNLKGICEDVYFNSEKKAIDRIFMVFVDHIDELDLEEFTDFIMEDPYLMSVDQLLLRIWYLETRKNQILESMCELREGLSSFSSENSFSNELVRSSYKMLKPEEYGLFKRTLLDSAFNATLPVELRYSYFRNYQRTASLEEIDLYHLQMIPDLYCSVKELIEKYYILSIDSTERAAYLAECRRLENMIVDMNVTYNIRIDDNQVGTVSFVRLQSLYETIDWKSLKTLADQQDKCFTRQSNLSLAEYVVKKRMEACDSCGFSSESWEDLSEKQRLSVLSEIKSYGNSLDSTLVVTIECDFLDNLSFELYSAYSIFIPGTNKVMLLVGEKNDKSCTVYDEDSLIDDQEDFLQSELRDLSDILLELRFCYSLKN